MTRIAGVDIGSSGIKYVILDIDKLEIIEYDKVQYSSNLATRDFINVKYVEKIFNNIIDHLIKKNVEKIGIASMAPVITFIDKDYNPLVSFSYNTTLGYESVDYIYSILKKYNIYVKIDIQNILHKILWLRRRMPRILNESKYVIDLNGYLFSKMLKDKLERPLQDIFTAYEWGIIDCNKLTWNYNIINIGDFNFVQYLPNLVKPCYTENYNNVEISIGTVDAIAGTYGGILDAQNSIFLNCGTSCCISIINDNIPIGDFYVDLYFNDKKMKSLCFSDFLHVVSWLERFLNERIDINKIIINNKPSGIIFIPYLYGKKNPPNVNVNAKALIYGLSGTSSKSDLIKSVIESLAYVIVDMIKYLDNGKKEIIAGGGMAHSNILSIVSAIIKKPIKKILYNPTAVGAGLISIISEYKIKDYRELHDKLGVEDINVDKKLDIYSNIYLQYSKIYKYFYNKNLYYNT